MYSGEAGDGDLWEEEEAAAPVTRSDEEDDDDAIGGGAMEKRGLRSHALRVRKNAAFHALREAE